MGLFQISGKKKWKLKIIIGRAKRAPHWGVQLRFRVIYIYLLEKWFPLRGEQAHSLKFLKTPISILIKYNHSIFLLSSSASRANLSCVVATIFTSLAFLSSSVSMTNLSRLVAASFSSLALSSSVSMANLSCLLVTTFSSLKLLSNSLSSPRLHLLRVGRRCYSVVFCFLTYACYPQHLKLRLIQVSHF